MNYRHSQRGPLAFPLAITGGALIGGAIRAADHTPLMLILGASGLAFLILAASFSSLTITDRGDALRVRFGPLPIFGTTIPYAAITSARAARTALIDGLGIHYFPFRGWTYNIWGRNCVTLRTARGTVRLGTDDPQGLERFLLLRAAPSQRRAPA